MFSAEMLVEMNKIVGETGKLLNRSNLDSALSTLDYYETPALQVASVCRSIIQNHPFVDGNKRTGIWFAIAASRVLGLRRIVPNEKELTELVVRIAVERWPVEQIAYWIRHG